MSTRKKRTNISCALLTDEENDILFRFMKEDCYVVSSTIAKLIVTKRNRAPIWNEVGQGVICFVKNYSRRKYLLQLFDIYQNGLIWEHELEDDFSLIQLCQFNSINDAAVTFIADNYVYCLNFICALDVAEQFTDTVHKTYANIAKRIIISEAAGPSVNCWTECHSVLAETSKKGFGEQSIEKNVDETSFQFNFSASQPAEQCDENSSTNDTVMNSILGYFGYSVNVLSAEDVQNVLKVVEKNGGSSRVLKLLKLSHESSNRRKRLKLSKITTVTPREGADTPVAVVEEGKTNLALNGNGTIATDQQILPSFIKMLNDIKDILKVVMSEFQCLICLQSVVEPVLCESCKQIIGCKMCVNKWLNRNKHRNCIICRSESEFSTV